MSKPIVALSCDVDDDDRIRLRQEYFEVVAAAGGIPVVMPPFVEQSRIGEWLDAVGAEAVLLTGGCDPDPQIYREYPREGLGRVSLRRDVYELGLLDCAMERNLAVLGICRGLQLVNVAFGGTLYQDMASQMGDEFAPSVCAHCRRRPHCQRNNSRRCCRGFGMSGKAHRCRAISSRTYG